ncbi:MAG: hypothetical protein JO276_08185 [Sphingomonadaceae bacterium]|nr:hypothetical protein [Sphingomonadaceae bacterium]
MGLGFILVVCLYIGMFVAMLVMGIVVAIVAVATGSPAALATLLVVFGLILMCGTLYAEVRISLAFPLSFVRRDFIIGEAWRLSRGRFWTLFGAYFVLALLYSVLASLLLGLAIAPLVSELTQASQSPDAIRAAFQHELELVTGPSAVGIAVWLGFALLGGLALALFGGAVATAARDLLAGDPALAEPPRG